MKTSKEIMEEMAGMSEEERKIKGKEVNDKIGRIEINDEERMMDLIMIRTAFQMAEDRTMWDETPEDTKFMAIENLTYLSSKYFSLYDVQIEKTKGEK